MSTSPSQIKLSSDQISNDVKKRQLSWAIIEAANGAKQTSEEVAMPRKWHMKAICGTVVLWMLSIGGAFYSGIAYQKSLTNSPYVSGTAENKNDNCGKNEYNLTATSEAYFNATAKEIEKLASYNNESVPLVLRGTNFSYERLKKYAKMSELQIEAPPVIFMTDTPTTNCIIKRRRRLIAVVTIYYIGMLITHTGMLGMAGVTFLSEGRETKYFNDPSAIASALPEEARDGNWDKISHWKRQAFNRKIRVHWDGSLAGCSFTWYGQWLYGGHYRIENGDWVRGYFIADARISIHDINHNKLGCVVEHIRVQGRKPTSVREAYVAGNPKGYEYMPVAKIGLELFFCLKGLINTKCDTIDMNFYGDGNADPSRMDDWDGNEH